MKIRPIFSISVMSTVLALGAVINAQESRSSGTTTQESQEREKDKEKHLLEMVGAAHRVFALVNRLENHAADQVVTGAPFSAQIVVENNQTLANGVHINGKSVGMLYRDSDGRTRNEEPGEASPEMVFISDPIARVDYHLHMSQRTAVKSVSGIAGRRPRGVRTEV